MQAQGTAEAPAQYVSPLTFTSGASPSGVNNAASAFNPVVTPTPAQPTVRQHKCTKCGQTGHIRTNKRYHSIIFLKLKQNTLNLYFFGAIDSTC